MFELTILFEVSSNSTLDEFFLVFSRSLQVYLWKYVSLLSRVIYRQYPITKSSSEPLYGAESP